MKPKDIQFLLHEIAKTEVPPAEVDLWPAVRQRLLASKHFISRKGDSMNRPSTHARRLRLAISTLLLLFLLAVLTLFTPQGRAFAQSVYHLFVPAQATSFPIIFQATEPAIKPAIEPVETTSRPTTLVTFTTVADAEEIVGFDIREFAADPEGFTFGGVTVDAERGVVYTHYTATGGELRLTQIVGDFPSSPWSEIPAEAIEVTSVAGFYAEYAQGSFVVYPGATSATWEPTAPFFRLRWSDGQFLFSLDKMGDTFPIEWLDRDAMIHLAEELMANP
jgi:hypothetical protein